MTGYGKAEAVLETGKLTIEIKTLNGKNSDANIKSSLLPKDKELLVRRKITDSLVRGTIDFYVNWEPKAGGMAKQINKELLREYYDQLMDFSASLPVFDSLSFNPNEMLASILRFPDVMDNSRQDIITEENWPVVERLLMRLSPPSMTIVRRRGRLSIRMSPQGCGTSLTLRIRWRASRRRGSMP